MLRTNCTFLSIMLVFCIIKPVKAQNGFDYDAYFFYRNHQYLATPSILLTCASIKAASGDTLAAMLLLEEAATLGLYSTDYITYRAPLKFAPTQPGWRKIVASIEQNRQKFSDPHQMQVITSDITNFWKLYDKIWDTNADKWFIEEYIMTGSIGLRTFFEVRMGLRATNLISTVKQKNRYYESIRSVSQDLDQYKPQLATIAQKMEQLYPASIFPPIFFTMGNFSAFGTTDGGIGQLIGAEFLCNIATADTTQLNKWEKSVIADTSKILGIVTHELIHIQQNTAPASTLLERSINEGAADFICQLLIGYHINVKTHTFANPKEKEIWNKFSKQMNGTDVSQWLYNGADEKRKDYPADLGYYVGYKICESYYNLTDDKSQAVQDILNIANFKQFLEKSRYATKFE